MIAQPLRMVPCRRRDHALAVTAAKFPVSQTFSKFSQAKHNRFHAGPPAWIERKFTFILRLF